MDSASQSVVISSPRFSLHASRQLVQLARVHQLRGIRFSVLLSQEAISLQNQSALHTLRGAGIIVHELPQLHECFTLIDGNIVWYGNVHVLVRRSVENSMMRLVNRDIAHELMRTLALRSQNPVSPSLSPELPMFPHFE